MASRFHPPRRRVLKGIAGGVLLPAATGALAQLPQQRPPLFDISPLMKDIVKGAPVIEKRVKLDIPHLAENGHLVPVNLSIDSPMSDADHVKTLWILSEKNPRPLIAKMTFSPGMGKAALVTRIRLATAQWVVALAQMSDGGFYADATEVIVTETACLDAT
jgi:sulfur-oxidizing protein SoxY